MVQTLPFWLLMAAAPLLVGATQTSIQLYFSTAAACLTLLCVVAPRKVHHGHPMVVWLFALPMFICALQLIPLPFAWLAGSSPEAAALRGLEPSTTSWVPLSLAPSATALSFLHYGTCLLVYLGIASAGRRIQSKTALLLTCLGTLTVVIALIHYVSGARSVYGLYSSLHRTHLDGFFGPFINENTFAGFLVLSAFVAIGVCLEARNPRETKFAAFSSVMCFCGAIATGSRGALIAIFFGFITLVLMTALTDQKTRPGLRSRLKTVSLALGSIIGIGGVFKLISSSELRKMLSSLFLDDPKVMTWWDSVNVMEAFPIFGSGRGTFVHVFTQFQTRPINGTVTHAENFVVQSFTEFGVIFGLIALLLPVILWCLLVVGYRKRPSGLLSGVCAAMAAIGCHQFTDFGLEAMGLSLPLAAALAVATSHIQKRRPQNSFKWVKSLLSLGLLCVATLYGSQILRTAKDAHIDALAKTTRVEEIERQASEWARSFPADWMIPATAAQAMLKRDDIKLEKIIRWAHRAQTLAPMEARPHLLTAEALYRASMTGQAAGEFRRAIEKAPWNELAYISDVARLFKTPEHVLAATPNTPASRRRLVESLFRQGNAERVQALAEERLLWEPDSLVMRLAKMRACQRLSLDTCLRELRDWFHAKGYLGLSKILEAADQLRAGDRTSGQKTLSLALDYKGQNRALVARHGLRMATRLNHAELQKRSLDILWQLSRGDATKAYEVLTMSARIYRQQGKYQEALRAMEQALTLRRVPQGIAVVADLENKLGLKAQAERRLVEALNQFPNHPGLKSTLERIQRADTKAPTRND